MIKKIAKHAINIISFGGYDALGAAISQYETKKSIYEELRSVANNVLTDIKLVREQIEVEVEIAIESANQANMLLAKVNSGHILHPFNIKAASADAVATIGERVHTNPGLSGTAALCSGGAIGSAVAVGSWTTVSLIGTASTGTAIGTLSGAAMSNAVLAWFGGGSLAAGGGGMAAGSLVLGGLVVVPLIAWTSWSMYSKKDKVLVEVKNITASISKAQVQIEELHSFQTPICISYAEL